MASQCTTRALTGAAVPWKLRPCLLSRVAPQSTMQYPRWFGSCWGLAAVLLLVAQARAVSADAGMDLGPLAEEYVRLVLAIGEHDANMVDAYYGPPEWRQDARDRKRSLESLDSDAGHLADRLAKAAAPDDLSALRRRALGEQLASIRARLAILRGAKLSFDEEARRIYGVSPPHHDDDFYRAIHRQLDAVVPGEGPLRDRMAAFKKMFVVPRDRIHDVIDPAILACRDATLRHIALPAGENFRLELVTDKPWGAYNWFQGNYQSLIEVNISLPFYANQAARLMCHEGYPGHHVLNSLLEQELVKDRGWMEYTVYPLYSSESLLAEGTADFGFSLVFPGDTSWQWERDRLYPVAGIDPALAEVRFRVNELNKSLGYAAIDAARAYLDGDRSRDQTIAWLREFTFATREEAERSVRFYETYRSYVVNYRLGEDLVRQYIDKVAGEDPDARWKAFASLLSSPPVVSDLARGTTLDPSK